MRLMTAACRESSLLFHAADGSELFRHEGFFSREDILAKWRELGVDTCAS